jgi:hypothetical protein
MNDLAEKALHGLTVARRAVRDRVLLSFGIVGFGIALIVVVAGGAVGALQPTRPLTTWLGLQDSSRDIRPNVAAALLLCAVVALVALWFAVVEYVRRVPQRAGRVWWLAAAWGAPFAVGPPLMNTSVYSYAAYGLVQRRGHDPYAYVPSRLGESPAVAAIDPASRGTPSGSGPLGTLIQHLAVSAGNGSSLAAVVALRIVAVLAVVWAARLAAELGSRHPDRALTLVALNPLVLLYLVSAARLDALMIAFLLAALVAAKQRRWLGAVALVCLAGSVTAPAFVVLPVLVAAHLAVRRLTPRWQVVGGDLFVAAAVTAALGLVVSGGFGWVGAGSKQFSTHTPFSIAGATSVVLTPIVRGASYDDFAIGGRVTAMAAMVCAIGYLVLTTRVRGLERSAGYALLAVGLFAPVLHPWYLLWGALCLAPSAVGARRIGVLALCAGGCVLVPPGFTDTVANVLTGVLLLAVLGGVAAVLAPMWRGEQATGGSAGQAHDARAAGRNGRDVAGLRAFRRPRRRDVDAL